MQNDRQRCKIKVRKFVFDILWRFGVVEENPKGEGGFQTERVFKIPVRIHLNDVFPLKYTIGWLCYKLCRVPLMTYSRKNNPSRHLLKS